MTRRVLLLTHTGREAARAVAMQCARSLVDHGIVVRMPAEEAAELGISDVEPAPEVDPDSDCELVLVIGGDGTILRAAEITHDMGTPLLGVNLGHVGFLAEAEEGDVATTISAIVDRSYSIEERLTINVRVIRDGVGVYSSFALNEASVEKVARARMIDVGVEIDARPLSRWGCDGVVVSTPTGSTAYSFSAGGPIVWPTVDAFVVIPLSAHALFARPLVVAPTSTVVMDVLASSKDGAVLTLDGRRTFDLAPGDRVEVTQGKDVELVRIHTAPFTDRLVAKFALPVAGWRGDH